jgi:hypothetical protein
MSEYLGPFLSGLLPGAVGGAVVSLFWIAWSSRMPKWARDHRKAARKETAEDVVTRWRASDPKGKNWTLHILEIALGLPSPYTTEELKEAYERESNG